MGLNKAQTFTTLAELKTFINSLSEDELVAMTNVHDWYVIELVNGSGLSHYYEINGYEGGEE